MHLRRALLLFAIVLGVAALAASLSRPLDERRADRTAPEPRPQAPATAEPGPAVDVPEVVSFDAVKNESRRMRAGDAATLSVSVPEAGTVAIADMGLSDAADPFTPAQFDVFPTKPGRYPLLFMPAGGSADEPAGTLVVTSAG